MGILDQIVGEMEGVEHAQPEQIELDDPDRRTVVLVPLEHGPALHPAPLERDDLMERPVGDHHAPGVDPEMTGKPVESPADVIDHVGGEAFGERRLESKAGRVAAVHVLRQAVDLRLGHPEHLSDVA